MYIPATISIPDPRRDGETCADIVIAVQFACELVRANLLGHHQRARALDAALDRCLRVSPEQAGSWERELDALRTTWDGVYDYVPPAAGRERFIEFAAALDEQLYLPHPMLTEWYLLRCRTARVWNRRSAVRQLREYLLSYGIDPTDSAAMGAMSINRFHTGLDTGVWPRLRVVYFGGALGDAGRYTLIDVEASIGRDVHSHTPLTDREAALLEWAADPSVLEPVWHSEVDDLLSVWIDTLDGIR